MCVVVVVIVVLLSKPLFSSPSSGSLGSCISDSQVLLAHVSRVEESKGVVRDNDADGEAVEEF